MKVTKYIWVDTPSGWQYGFPKKLDQALYADEDFNMVKWCVKQGYPEEMLDEDGSLAWVRMWEAE